VAAYPVDGPLEVLGHSEGKVAGGILDADLKSAWYRALAVPRHEARARALEFSWEQSSRMFLDHLVPVSQDESKAGLRLAREDVTSLSSNV